MSQYPMPTPRSEVKSFSGYSVTKSESYATSNVGSTITNRNTGTIVPLPPLPNPSVASLPASVRKPSRRLLSAYRAVSWMLGFRDNFSLLWFFVFGGTLLGFCLARSMQFRASQIIVQTVPGEFFWYGRLGWKVTYYIHIYMTLVGGILVGLQFLPGIRRTQVLLHRINGYTCLFLLIVGNICGSVVAYHSFGGEINVQLTYYLLGIMITFSGLMGRRNVKKDTRQHRKWMLRMVTYFCVIITARVIMLAAREIVTLIGNYYSPWRCDQLLYTINYPALSLSQQSNVQSAFPLCFGSGVDPSQVFVAVRANTKGGKLGLVTAVRVVQGMSLWIATVMHILGIEYYLKRTEKKNATRYGYVLEAEDFEADGLEPWEYK